MRPLTNPGVCSDHYDCKECSEYLDYAVPAERSETLALAIGELQEILEIEKRHLSNCKVGTQAFFDKQGQCDDLESYITAIRSLDTTHLSEIRELEIRLSEHSAICPACIESAVTKKDVICNRRFDLEQQLESLRGRGKG